jgi:hypothetical protein
MVSKLFFLKRSLHLKVYLNDFIKVSLGGMGYSCNSKKDNSELQIY